MLKCITRYNEFLKRPEWLGIDMTRLFVHTSQNERLLSNVSVACSYLRQGMMTKRSTHALKGNGDSK